MYIEVKALCWIYNYCINFGLFLCLKFGVNWTQSLMFKRREKGEHNRSKQGRLSRADTELSCRCCSPPPCPIQASWRAQDRTSESVCGWMRGHDETGYKYSAGLWFSSSFARCLPSTRRRHHQIVHRRASPPQPSLGPLTTSPPTQLPSPPDQVIIRPPQVHNSQTATIFSISGCRRHRASPRWTSFSEPFLQDYHIELMFGHL